MLVLSCAAVLLTPTARAQTVTGDDLAVVLLGQDDLPGFTLAGDTSPPATPDEVREQRTRIFTDDADAGTLLSLILSAPHADAVCLPQILGSVANGDVLGALNGDKPNYQSLGSLGAGDVDTAAIWNDFDAGRGAWYTVSEDVFMRGELVVYVEVVAYGTPPAADQLAGWARLQDAKLLAATADPASAAGVLARTPVPASPADDPTACS